MGFLCIEAAMTVAYCVLYAVYSAKKHNKAATWGMAALCVILCAAVASVLLII